MTTLLKRKRTRLAALMRAHDNLAPKVVAVIVIYPSKRQDDYTATMGRYHVVTYPEMMTCTCPDYAYRRAPSIGFGDCKHIAAARLLWIRARHA